MTKQKRVLALKQELDEGLKRWGEQVLDVQESNIKRAEKQIEDDLKRRKEKVRSERKSREKQVRERKKEVVEQQRQDLEMKRMKIQEKDKRVNSSFILANKIF